MDAHEQAEELQRLRQRLHDVANDIHALQLRAANVERDQDYWRDMPSLVRELVSRMAAVENDVENLITRAETYITRIEFTPVARVVYGLVAFILGGAVAAMLGLIFKVVRVP